MFKKKFSWSFTTLIILILTIISILLLLFCIKYVILKESGLPKIINLSAELGRNKHTIQSFKTPVLRLPHDFVPLLYKLDFVVYLPYSKEIDFGSRNFTINGQMLLNLYCLRTTTLIRLHSTNIKINYDKLKIIKSNLSKSDINDEIHMKDCCPKVIAVKHDSKTSLFTILTNFPMYATYNYTLEIPYIAYINQPEVGGMFYNSYKMPNGEKRLLVATQMQPQEARRLFPCFDEPSFKAQFDVRIRHPTGLTAVSNMDVVKVKQLTNNWTYSEFKRTPKMSTYLLAIALTDFPYIEQKLKNKKIRVWGQPSKIAHLNYALHVAKQSLEYFENYFQIPYPLIKLDIIGLPVLRVVAMENWGLIFSQQEIIIYEPGIQSNQNRQLAFEVIAHEIAHQWFSNLVTMEWWNDLWLNEGFATMMALKAVDHIENSTIKINEFFFENTLKAFQFEEKTYETHSLSHPINTNLEIIRNFNRITYLKAASILRMLESIIGPDLFRFGVQIFLNKFAYSNAKTEDLLNTLSETLVRYDPKRIQGTHWNITTLNPKLLLINLMQEWFYSPGFPLVSIINSNFQTRLNSNDSQLKTVHQFNQNNQKLYKIKQFLFTIYSNNVSNSADITFLNQSTLNANMLKGYWNVPLFVDQNNSLQTKQSKVYWALFENNTDIVENDEIIDSQAYGYYRLHYSSYDGFIAKLKYNYSQISVVARARLLDDTFTIARLGIVPYKTVFSLSEYLVNETEHLPLMVFHNHALIIFQLLKSKYSIEASLFKEFTLYILTPAYNRIFAKGIYFQFKMEKLRELLMFNLCLWKYQPCIDTAQKEFAQLRLDCQHSELSNQSCNKIPPELREAVYSVAVSFGDTSNFKFLERKFLNESYNIERNRILTGLASTQNITIINYTFFEFFPRLRQSDLFLTTNVEEEFLTKLSKSQILEELTYYVCTNINLLAKRIPFSKILMFLFNCITTWMHSEDEFLLPNKFKKHCAKEFQLLQSRGFFDNLKIEIQKNKMFIEDYAVHIINYLKSYPIKTGLLNVF